MSSQKLVLTTGANKGVSFETAKSLIFSSDDYYVLIGGRVAENGRKAVETLQTLPNVKGTVEPVTINVTEGPSIQAAAKYVEQRHSHLDCLINNSGVSNDSKNPAEQIRENLAVNTVGPIVVTDIFLHILKKSSNPRLIFVTSSLGSLKDSNDPSTIYEVKADYHDNSCRASKDALNMILIEFHKREGGKMKVWEGDADRLVTNLANAEMMRKLGAPHPSVGDEQISRCAKGEHDANFGNVISKYGNGKW